MKPFKSSKFLAGTLLAFIIIFAVAPLYRRVTQARLDHELLKSVQTCSEADVAHLLNKGADPNAQLSSTEFTWKDAISQIFFHSHSYTDKAPRNLIVALDQERDCQSCVKLLLSKHANPNVRAHNGASALFLAYSYSHYSSMEQLLAYGAEVQAPWHDDSSPLRKSCVPIIDAARDDDAFAVALLCKYGADVNSRDTYGYTVLMLAVRQHSKKAILALLANGANVNTTSYSKDKWTALDFARQENDVYMINTLRKAGAN